MCHIRRDRSSRNSEGAEPDPEFLAPQQGQPEMPENGVQYDSCVGPGEIHPQAKMRAVMVENAATSAGLRFHDACWYSLIRPPSLVRRRILWGFQDSATGLDLGFYAARSYSLIRPPRRGRRWIRFASNVPVN